MTVKGALIYKDADEKEMLNAIQVAASDKKWDVFPPFSDRCLMQFFRGFAIPRLRYATAIILSIRS